MAPGRIVLYPRSFLGLLLAGFTLVILPLVGALAYSAWNTERLASKSRTAVFNASQAARASRSLVDRIAAIERVAQQMALLNDPELANDYARVIGYLGRNNFVRSAQPVAARDDGILVKLSLATDLAKFLEAIGMERTLGIVAASKADGIDATLALSP